MGAASGGPGDHRRTKIGRRLRAARAAQRLSLADLADECGLTKGFLSKLERDQVAPSVASLLRVCDALGLSVGELFDSSQSHDLVRAGDYPSINFGGELMDESLLTPTRERRVQVIHSEIHPGGGSGDEACTLPVDVEFVFVLEGHLEIALDGQTRSLHEGDALTFAPDTRHTFHNPSPDQIARVLWVLTPALPATGAQQRAEAEQP